ncbi:MAG: VWA domain-containing protein, partial [Spirochaetales bacterium]|nr:VWA domain-containing protein [Spirochaetales bacterium]
NSKYKIKIENLTYNDTLSAEEYEKNKVESISDVTFSLEKVDNPFLKFLAPTGKKLYIGTQNDITWEGVGFDNDVKIELVPEATSVSNYTIVNRTENDGCYEWTISEEVMENGDFDLGTEYKIRITVLDRTDFVYLSGIRQGDFIDRMIDKDGNPITDKDGNEIVLENPGTLVAEGENYLEAILAPNVYFLLDDSGSMATSNRIGTLKKRMDNAAVALAKNFNIGIMSLNNTMKELPLKKGWTADDIRSSYAALKASGVTPTGPSLEKILNNKKYEMEDDIYKEYRRKAVVVITDGQPQDSSGTTQGLLDSFKNAVTKSSLLAGNGIPVFYMGINATGSLADKLQDMAVAGGTDNPKDESTPHKNWYPIDADNQFEAALNEIMYGDLEVAGSMVEYEIECDTPDSGNSIYFFGDHLLLGGTTSPSSASGLLKATYKDGKYSIKIRKQDNVTFSWGIVEADAKGNILKIEKSPLHTSDETSTTFNGWDENTIVIKVKQSLGYNYIYAWDIKAETPILNTWPGVVMTLSGSDYVYTILGRTSCGLLITKQNGDKLYETDMKISAPGIYRVDKNGIKKEN